MEVLFVQWFDQWSTNASTLGSVGFDSQQRRIIQSVGEKNYQRSLAWRKNTVRNWSHTTAQGWCSQIWIFIKHVELSALHKTCRIVGCNIIYVMFVVLYNSIIDIQKKNLMFPILIILTHDYSYENKYDQYMIYLVLPEYIYVSTCININLARPIYLIFEINQVEIGLYRF